MKIIPLSEGSFTVDKTKQFITFNSETDNLQQRTTGSLLVEIQPFVIVTEKDILLLDTGLGFTEHDGNMQIHKNLLDNGIDPSGVTKVLLSHLHKDHSGGISKDENGKRVLSFSNATYYINRQEFELATEKNSASYRIDDFNVLKNSPQLTLLDGNGIIDDYIEYQLTGAHSLYHQVFWINEGNKAFFGGDVAPQLQQLKNRFIAKYDYNGRKSMELRQQWKIRGEAEKWTFLFYHDIKTPTFQFI